MGGIVVKAAVHASRFSLLGSCSGSVLSSMFSRFAVLGSRFAVLGSGFWVRGSSFAVRTLVEGNLNPNAEYSTELEHELSTENREA
jgi:hypothetical protein